MDVNSNVDVKSVGLPAVPSPGREGIGKNQTTTPVEQSGDSAKSSLEQKAREQQGGFSSEQLAKAVKEVQERLDALGTKLNFSLDEKTESIVIQVKDKKSGDLVRQIPSEEMLELKVKLEKLLGVLFDQRV